MAWVVLAISLQRKQSSVRKNPLRMYARNVPGAANRSQVQFVRLTGNNTGTNPWGYTPKIDPSNPARNTNYFVLPMQSVSFTLPMRTAILDDIDTLITTVEEDIAAEMATLEGLSMVRNNDQAGSTTTATGATDGLRGLATYAAGTPAYGTSGAGLTNGLHTIANVNFSLAAAAIVKYQALESVVNALPPAYWNEPSVCWMIHPEMIKALRLLTDANGLPIFLDFGDYDAGPAGGFGGMPKPMGKLRVASQYLLMPT